MLCQKWMEQVLQEKDQNQAAEWAGAKKTLLRMIQQDPEKEREIAVMQAVDREKGSASKAVQGNNSLINI